MEEKLPIKNNSKNTSSLAVTYIQTLMEENEWIFRRADGSDDYGIDSEVEIVDETKVTGKLFKCQIKGTESIEFKGGYASVSVNVSTWNNWKNINIPTIALLCDITLKRIYWCIPLGFEPKIEADSVTIKFPEAHCLNDNFEEFKSIINTWIDSFPSKNILLEVPFYHNLFTEELSPLIDWGDAWCQAGHDIDMQIRVFYSHVLSLRASLGIRNDKVFPFEYWLIRNQGIWDDPMRLYYGTISEILSYIKYFYEEALDKLKNRLKKVGLDFKYNELVNYFKLHEFHKERENIEVVISHPYGKLEKFHKIIEAKLIEVGYTPKFKWKNKDEKSEY